MSHHQMHYVTSSLVFAADTLHAREHTYPHARARARTHTHTPTPGMHKVCHKVPCMMHTHRHRRLRYTLTHTHKHVHTSLPPSIHPSLLSSLPPYLRSQTPAASCWQGGVASIQRAEISWQARSSDDPSPVMPCQVSKSKEPCPPSKELYFPRPREDQSRHREDQLLTRSPCNLISDP